MFSDVKQTGKISSI